MRELHDHYFRQAKKEGYLSRAAYKLIEIDDRKKVLNAGDYVLDCGCAPGSWLQVASARVGPEGMVVGIDLNPVSHECRAENVRAIVGDLQETDLDVLRHEIGGGEDARFDVILSDLAPRTTGERTMDHHQSIRLCESVLGLCRPLLAEGGTLVMKVFEGEAYPDLLNRLRGRFDKVKGFKPKASRDVSTEMYVVAEGWSGGDDDEDAAPPEADDDARLRSAPPKPPPGWGGG